MHIAGDQGLNDQALDRPDEQGGGGLDIQAWVELAGVATAIENDAQPLAVQAQQRGRHPLGCRGAGALKLAEHHPGHAGVFGNEAGVGQEHRLECGGRGRSGLRRAIDPVQQAVGQGLGGGGHRWARRLDQTSRVA